MQEKTLVLIKPHLLSARHSDQVLVDIINRYLEAGLRLESPIKSFRLYGRQIRELYRQHFGKPFFPKLERDMTRGYCVAMIWSGRNAVRIVRRINGATKSAEAKPGTIRCDYGDRKNLSNNAVHSSESRKAAEKEIRLIFGVISD